MRSTTYMLTSFRYAVSLYLLVVYFCVIIVKEKMLSNLIFFFIPVLLFFEIFLLFFYIIFHISYLLIIFLYYIIRYYYIDYLLGGYTVTIKLKWTDIKMCLFWRNVIDETLRNQKLEWTITISILFIKS